MRYSPSFTHEKKKPLAKLTTLGIGGAANFFAKASTIEELSSMLKETFKHKIPTLIIGKGSNALFDDRGFDGLIIQNKIDHFKQEEGRFTVGSGYSFPRLGVKSASLGFGGLEFAAGIPATVGGAIYMNAGANGKETADTLERVGYLSEKGEYTSLSKEQLQFAYRESSFQKRGGAIVEATFALTPSPEAKQWQKKMVDYRLQTQPYKLKSAGCAFRNPEGHSAGQLIEECGLKGYRVGGVSISEQHANFIVNDKQGSAANVKELIDHVKESVYREKGISLSVEIRYIPYNV
ncbi:MAG: UDP-N-acetylenolpyruvoylglucosamine reductase [Chlamydiales bacterium]|nr:UDP-N-acetylenolpyruvoylglucosamine reductase [Chlamydiales bacterium]MCH9620428.1 UDP-N-acetylenolpyruvoylglucosamine reductase [Chlamydiales bacterium]MCH9622926.1 UDP-N-acetylenolpyruvoylglucosamine reductase [Chlamydiales bacterium]